MEHSINEVNSSRTYIRIMWISTVLEKGRMNYSFYSPSKQEDGSLRPFVHADTQKDTKPDTF